MDPILDFPPPYGSGDPFRDGWEAALAEARRRNGIKPAPPDPRTGEWDEDEE